MQVGTKRIDFEAANADPHQRNLNVDGSGNADGGLGRGVHQGERGDPLLAGLEAKEAARVSARWWPRKLPRKLRRGAELVDTGMDTGMGQGGDMNGVIYDPDQARADKMNASRFGLGAHSHMLRSDVEQVGYCIRERGRLRDRLRDGLIR